MIDIPRKHSLIGFALLLAACGDSLTSPPPPPPPVASVAVSPGTASVQVGQNTILTAVTLDANGGTLSGRAVTWSANPQAIATVANGVVTGVSAGLVTIAATSDGNGRTTGMATTRQGTSPIRSAPSPGAPA